MSGPSFELEPEGLDLRMLIRIFAAVAELDSQLLISNNSESAVSSGDKALLMERIREQMTPLLLHLGLAGPQAELFRIAVSRSLTGRSPQGQPFLVTSFGPQLSVEERKLILTSLGETGSNSQAKALKLGASSEVDLEPLGLGPGYVGPFCKAAGNLAKFFIERPSGIGDTPLVLELAGSTTHSLFFPAPAFVDVLHTYEASIGAELTQVLVSPDRVIFPAEPQV